ncbi:PQQ-dependent sugar dehydrogenase [Prosthecobacter fluviatilis]|uniref:PQQ-dependent sugar dehydrogenase n=1 Tax=Prosthecobacter fluviatilis TaxID=445931 RepID=A0ABW0KMN4_9BACT
MTRVLLLCLAFSTTIHAQWTTSRIQGSPEAAKPCIPEQAFPGIVLHEALEMVPMPGARRFIAVEKGGKIWSFKDAPDARQQDLLIDLKPGHPQLQYAYGIAFHPKWRENGHVFLCYAYGDKVPDGTKLSRFKLSQQEPPVLDPTSETVLLTWRSGGHNGASLQFGPDGMLYISTGDSEVPSPPDPLNTGQDISDLLSSILRIDVDRTENGQAYAIPPDNPFLKTPNAMPEIWAFGFRNPWKISFDGKGRLWCGDVGWELWEMIHLVQRGGNHGWSAYEASQPIKPETQRPEPVIPPVAAHPHTEAASITGGYVYHGNRFPELKDAYIYGDYETGKIWALWHDGKQVTRREEIADTPHKIVTFGQSEDGELYWMNWEKDTRIYRLAPNPSVAKPSQFPHKLSETGLFKDTASQTPAAGVLPFEIAEPMWQDGATATRFIALPQSSRIKTTRGGPPAKPNYKVEWPADSVLARTITWPATQQRIETQVLHFDGETWNGYSYRWNEKGTDAELVKADGEEFTVQKQPWRIHSRGECARCHTNWSGFTLGFQPDQLVRIAGKEPADVSELFDGPFTEWQPAHLVSSHDPKPPLETRARSWLHANCAHCHRRHGGGSVPLMLNFDLPTAETMTVYEKPTRGDFGISDPAVIYPWAPHRSILFQRVARTGSGHMPMIGARDPDPAGLKLLWEWISGISPKKGPAESYVSKEDMLQKGDSEHEAELLSGRHPENEHRIHADPLHWFRSSPTHLMMAVSNEQIPQPRRAAAIKAAMASGDPNITSLFERFLPPDQRVKTLGMNFDVKKLLAVQGNAKRGGELLSMTGKMAACFACHIINGSGHDFGPDLSKVGARLTREQILESLKQPSKVIAKGYETWVVTLKDGRVQTGFITRSNGGSTTMKLPGGQPQAIAQDQIQSQQSQPSSLMPEGLLQSMTEQEAADVVSYLSGLK